MQQRLDQSQSTYGENYLRWKGWNTQQPFGELTLFEKIQFDHEIRRTRVRPIKNILEVGFGNGNFLSYAKQRGWVATGIEVNESLVSLGHQASFDTHSADKLKDLPTASFDLIVAFDVFEHIPEEELADYLCLLRTKLHPNGAILARFPNGDSSLGLYNQNSDLTHRTFIGSGKIRHLAGDAGLEVVRLAAPAQPLICGSWLHFLHRLYALPLKFLIEFFIRAVFFPQARTNFTSANIVAVIKIPSVD